MDLLDSQARRPSAATQESLSRPLALALVACALLLCGIAARAQDNEPRAYSNAPVGMNFLVAGYAYTDGGLSLDPSLPVKDPQLQTNSILIAYARTLDLWGKSAKFDAILPYTWLSGTAIYRGQPVQRRVDGFSDFKFRFSINLFGAPALSLKDFATYKQDWIVGVSLQVSVPASQYDPSRLVNIGTHRWSFKPEVGISKRVGRWTWEGAFAATLFTTNHDFYGGQRRSQEPLYSAQAHAIYSFRGGAWSSLDVTYFTGGRTTLNDTVKEDRQQNWRVGGTLTLPVDPKNSVKLFLSDGVSARTGNNFLMAGLAWQHRWGGGR
jgi:hypothetical protein